jgi:hypothetical protein
VSALQVIGELAGFGVEVLFAGGEIRLVGDGDVLVRVRDTGRFDADLQRAAQRFVVSVLCLHFELNAPAEA